MSSGDGVDDEVVEDDEDDDDNKDNVVLLPWSHRKWPAASVSGWWASSTLHNSLSVPVLRTHPSSVSLHPRPVALLRH